jgi:hypothetical protein
MLEALSITAKGKTHPAAYSLASSPGRLRLHLERSTCRVFAIPHLCFAMYSSSNEKATKTRVAAAEEDGTSLSTLLLLFSSPPYQIQK